jgi:MFS family permease
VLIHPLEAEFGWSRTAIASAASLNLLLLGLFAPIGGWLIDRVVARGVILGCITTIAVGLVGTVFVQELWQLIILWGVVLGVATGVTPALGASIASRWFVDRRGLAIGIMTNANAAGQVVYLPLLMAIIVGAGWRSALIAMAAASAVLIPAIWFWMRDNPAEVGLEPYRSKALAATGKQRVYARGDIRPISISAISEVFKTSTFWIVNESTALFVFAVIYGLDWYASGPATTTIIARSFGAERVGRIFGLVFVFHQLGGASAAILGGWVRVHFGDYQIAFLVGGCLGLIAACLALTVRSTARPAPTIPATTALAGA